MLLCTQLFYYVALFKKVPALRTEFSSGDNCFKIGINKGASFLRVTLLLIVIFQNKLGFPSLFEDEAHEDKNTSLWQLLIHLSFQIMHSRIPLEGQCGPLAETLCTTIRGLSLVFSSIIS